MAIIDKTQDTIGSTQQGGFDANWDYKNRSVAPLTEDGLERFSQYSATPDSTMMFAGPARFTGLAGNTAELTPIGLTDGISIQSSPQLQRLYEIGSNRAFFTRGKTQSSVGFSRILADQSNILVALTANAYRPLQSTGGYAGPSGQPNPQIAMNIDSEYFSTPFGLMLIFKTRGGPSSTGPTDVATVAANASNTSNGKILCAIYLEYCVFSNYQFQIANQSPVIMEGLSIEFDRVVPVSMTN